MSGGLKYSILHRYHHSDYEVAKEHIYRQLGKLDIALHGRLVMAAVYVRPILGGTSSLSISPNMQAEDIIQGKIMLVIKTGPAAFGALDDESYRQATYGEVGAPKVGDWIMANAAAGDPTSFYGEGAETVMAEDRRGEMQKVYHWDSGWPCRLLSDDNFVATVLNPHSVV